MLKVLDALVLDIETTGTTDPAVIERIASKIKPPGSMSKADTIAKWEAETKPGAIQKAVDETALSGAYGSIIAIGTGVVSEGEDHAIKVRMGDERDLLEGLMATPVDHGCFPKLVGHAVAGFDLPFIRQRCIVNGVKIAHWFPRDPKPWSDTICDTMVAWAGVRDHISLSELAAVLGIEVAPTISGAEVPSAYAMGKVELVTAHCLEDVRVTREIYKRLVAVGL